MIIIHKIDDFLFNLFPSIKEGEEGRKEGRKEENLNRLKEELVKFYTFGPYKPKVEIEQDFIKIQIDISAISSQKSDFDTAVKHCEAGNFKKAKSLLEKLIKKNPTVSEYHRILGQIHSEEGRQEEAINSLIDALRWDPKNTHALTMMGNIFAKYKNDISIAMSYYEQVLAVKPHDHIAMNNIGANLMQLGRINEAARYFEKAFAINNTYPNTLYALGMLKDIKKDYLAAFDFAIQAMKKCKPENPVYSNAFELAQHVSLKAIKSIDPMEMFNQYSQKLAVDSGKNIDVIQDDAIPTSAKLEMAENYKRDKHVIRYKKDRLASAHLMIHELGHLDLTVQCRKRNANYLFITTKEQKELFIRNNEPIAQRLSKEGLDDKSIADYLNALFSGINSQIYNTPIDLFIEDFLYKNYPDLRLFQFLSLLGLLKEYIDVARSKKVMEYTPSPIRNANIILSLVNSFQFRALYGYDMTHLFKASTQQLKCAKEFFNEYLKYQKNNQVLEAHHLIQRWAQHLRIENYFSLIKENEYRSSRPMTESLVQEPEHFIKAEQQPVKKAQVDFSGEPAGQAAVSMYCLSALQYFESKNLDEIKKVGFEIAMLGRQGINPANSEKKYYLESIPGKEFSGLQLLVYMFSAFQIIDPFLDTGLNFKKEYETAKKMYKAE